MDAVVEALRRGCPTLFEDAVLCGVESGEVSLDEAARILGSEPLVLEWRLDGRMERSTGDPDEALIDRDAQGTARIVGKQVAVWEVVREFRAAGSVGGLRAAFPNLSEHEVRAALAYAGRYPDEVAEKIRAYEEMQERARSAYPFAKG
jgi:uncharacterized protein (DUF433 family)